MTAKRLFVGLLALGLPWSCAPDGGVEVRLDEYVVEVRPELPSGETMFSARNVGRIEHELLVLRTDLDPDDLPVEDGEAQTGAGGIEVLDRTDRIQPGAQASLTVRLRPGPYVIICNIPGHYQSGMRTGVQVS